MNSDRYEIIVIGRLPEDAGIGGVTIHVERLCQWLDKVGIAAKVCDYKKMSLCWQIKTILKGNIAHIHASNPILRVLYVILCRLLKRKVVLTIHGDLGRFGKIKNYLDKLSIQWCHIPIVINDNSYNKAIRWNGNTTLQSAYLPPLEEQYLPEWVKLQINAAKLDKQIIVCTNASVRSFTPDNKEIYGIDFLISYFSDNPSYYLFISDPSSQYNQFYKNKKIANLCFITEQHSFYELMKYSDIFIRATATDGDSLSVREGLDVGLKVIATDCVTRPSGTILFKYNDKSSLISALDTSVPSPLLSKHGLIEEILKVYKNCN